MKTRTSEQGSAHLIIIIVLIVALVGTLGFVFWQNFVNKPAEKSTTSTSQQTEINSDLPSGSKALTVSEWAVKSSYGGELVFGYTVFANDPNALLLTSGDSVACGQGIGTVYRLKSGEKAASSFFGGTNDEEMTAKDIYTSGNVSTQSKAGDYYYFLKDASGTCSSDTVTAMERSGLIQATKDFVESIALAN